MEIGRAVCSPDPLGVRQTVQRSAFRRQHANLTHSLSTRDTAHVFDISTIRGLQRQVAGGSLTPRLSQNRT